MTLLEDENERLKTLFAAGPLSGNASLKGLRGCAQGDSEGRAVAAPRVAAVKSGLRSLARSLYCAFRHGVLV